MKAIVILFLVSSLTPTIHGSTVLKQRLKDEGHFIAKRFAEQNYEFEGHDVAYVLHERHHETFHRINRRDLSSVTRDVDTKRLRLDLNYGGNLHLTLKKRSILDANTQIYHNTEHGLVKREAIMKDCYAIGHEGDSSDNLVSVSLCDGLHGTVSSNGMEYYIHPLTEDEVDHRVHVLWRRQTDDKNLNTDAVVAPEDETENDEGGEESTGKTHKKIEVELAMFTDAPYWAILKKMFPGRENDYNVIAMNAAGALYADKEKVGYDLRITLKLIVNWEKNPEDYEFKENLKHNLGSFCRYAQARYRHDMLYLHSGVTKLSGAVGFAYVGGVCKSAKCATSLLTSPERTKVIAHEIGHNLGFNHHTSRCSPDGGFMGGQPPLNFSSCNKKELRKKLDLKKPNCLFRDDVKLQLPEKYINQPRVLMGQFDSPDYLCQLFAGPGYIYYKPHEMSAAEICKLFLCLDVNTKSPSYRNIEKLRAPTGLPCGDEMFCDSWGKCKPWKGSGVGWDVGYLRKKKRPASWSDWSNDWSDCSRTCGTGVQIKERQCIVPERPFLSTYCTGSSIKSQLCATQSCSGDPETIEELRQARGDQVCADFLNNTVELYKPPYLSEYKDLSSNDNVPSGINPSKSCVLSCKRNPARTDIMIDGVMEGGTPCTEMTRSEYNLKRFRIEMRCARGVCMEFSDCENNEPKDACGVCAGNEGRCQSSTFTDDVTEGERTVLANIPVGSSGIDVQVVTPGGKLELWNSADQVIIGQGGQFPNTNYVDENVVTYGGTTWSFDSNQFIRSEGETIEDIVVKIVGTEASNKRVDVNYLTKAV